VFPSPCVVSPHYFYCNIIFALFAVLFSALLSAMFSSSSSSARSVRKADENNNAGRIDSVEDKRARLDSSDEEEQPAFASNVGDADGAPAPGATERHHEDHVVGAHASADRDARRTISEAAPAVEAESDVDETHRLGAQRSARNEHRRNRNKATKQAAACLPLGRTPDTTANVGTRAQTSSCCATHCVGAAKPKATHVWLTPSVFP
jgi:hypothetical protein